MNGGTCKSIRTCGKRSKKRLSTMQGITSCGSAISSIDSHTRSKCERNGISRSIPIFGKQLTRGNSIQAKSTSRPRAFVKAGSHTRVSVYPAPKSHRRCYPWLAAIETCLDQPSGLTETVTCLQSSSNWHTLSTSREDCSNIVFHSSKFTSAAEN